MTASDLNDLELAHHLADTAREVILPFFRHPELSAQNKLASGFDPVTAADRAAEEAMRKLLRTHRPQDGILGEEFGHQPGQSGREWVLDPIDGTRGFISGTPTWGVLIALSDETGPALGIIDQPYIGERFVGAPGMAESYGPLGQSRMATRDTARLEDAILFTTFPEVGSLTERAGFEAVAARARLTRFGCDCYAYALVASGQVDLVIEAGLHVYDIQAPIAVVQAAGGLVTDWRGGPAHAGGQAIAAANADLHAQALALLAPFAA